MTKTENIKINCRECIYYYVTWDVNKPYGCKAMGFKGKVLPSINVFSSTGKDCLLFQKKRQPISDQVINLNQKNKNQK